jgi:polyisoprenoid-binding protein YceI
MSHWIPACAGMTNSELLGVSPERSDMRNTITMRQLLLLMLCVLLLASCAVKPPTPAATAGITPEAAYPTDLRGAHLYRIDAQQSQLHILVYRAGTMAQLGHNHVMSSSNLSGYVWLHDSLLQRSGFDLRLPVNELIVDDPAARTAEGEGFPLNVTEQGRAGTKVNMLKPELLDGERYPYLSLTSVRISGSRAKPEVNVDITIKDKTRQLSVPVQLTVNGQTLQVAGEFVIKQTDFGITPQSVMMGALQVQDLLTIKFALVAVTPN